MEKSSFDRKVSICIIIVLFANAERVFFAFAIELPDFHENVKKTLRENVKKTLWFSCKRKTNAGSVFFEFAPFALQT